MEEGTIKSLSSDRLTVSDVEALMKKKAFIIHSPVNSKGPSFEIDVKVKDYKRVFGKNFFLVEPVAGKGAGWKHVKDVHFRD